MKTTKPKRFLTLLKAQKIIVLVCVSLLSINAIKAQSQNWWRTSGNTPATNEFLGTTNNTGLDIKTNNTQRVFIDANGSIKINSFLGTGSRLLQTDALGVISPFIMGNSNQVLYGNGTWGALPAAATIFTVNGSSLALPNTTTLSAGTLRSSNLSDNTIGLVYADAAGNLFKGPGSGSGGPNGINAPCINGALPWFTGGNILNSLGFDAGTCNNYDFILKANNLPSVFIKPSGSIGFGANFTSNSGDPVQYIFDSGILRTKGNNAFGGPQLVFDGPISPYGDWGMEYTGGTSAPQPGINFWKPFGSANSNNNILFLHDNNKIGIGTDNPSSRLTIDAWADNALLILTNPNKNVIDVQDKSNNKINFRVKANGYVYAREINVMPTTITFPDYVFNKNYNLKTISELENYIQTNKHLPNIPSAKEVEANGINVAEMQVKQMEKIEEAFLYIIQLKKENEELKLRLQKLESKH